MSDQTDTAVLALQMEVRNLSERLSYVELDCQALREAHDRLNPDDRLVISLSSAVSLVARR